MPRESKNETLNQVIKTAVDRVVARILATIEVQVNRAVSTRVATELKKSPRGARGRRNGVAKARPRIELVSWTADRRARRVPNFVIEATGLDIKKKIVAKYGENAKFEKGKPLPKAHITAHQAGSGETNGVKAKPPVVRKAATTK